MKQKAFAKWGLRAAAWLLFIVLVVLLALRAAAWMREEEDALPQGMELVATPLGDVAVRAEGPADGPAIMLVHGTAAWSGFWRDVSAHLAARGWRVVAIDLPPFGYSGRDPQARYDRGSQATRLAAVLNAQSRRPAVVLGHSFGAGAATELALRHPQRVRRLVLVDAALGRLDPVPAHKGSLERLLGLPLIAEPLTSATVTNPAAIGFLLRSMIVRKEAAEPWLETLRRPMRRSGTTAAYASWLPALFTADDGSLSRRRAELSAIKPEVALIWGSADTVTPLAQGEELARLMRARSLLRLPGVGHIPHIEDPAGFLAALDASIAPAGGKK